MATLPDSIPFHASGAERSGEPTETFLIDIDTGRVCRTGGGLEAMKQAVGIVLNIERYAYQIYSSNFGRELNSLIGKPAEYMASMLKRRVGEAFLGDPRILSVDNFVFDMSGTGAVKCSFQVNTAYGAVPAEVEI